eukprot:scaffold34615_cov180-Amphora_coffeaeformis.AAC.10
MRPLPRLARPTERSLPVVGMHHAHVPHTFTADSAPVPFHISAASSTYPTIPLPRLKKNLFASCRPNPTYRHR